MLFDKLCGAVEDPDRLKFERRPLPSPLAKAVKTIRAAVQAANLFDFPVVPGDVDFGTKAMEEDRELLGEKFFLPFETVAVEDKVSCVLLRDLTANASGIDAGRFFVDCQDLHPKDEVCPDMTVRAKLAGFRELLGVNEGVSISWGHVQLRYTVGPKPVCHTQFACGGVIIVSNRVVHSYLLGEESLDSMKFAMTNVQAAVEEIAYFNTPSRWIVEMRGPDVRDEDRPRRIRRNHDRPKFTVLEPGEIRKLFGGDGGSHESPSPHPRRRHYRTLRSDRYAKSGLQGKSILIPATWVGPEEAIVGNKRYIVRTDL